MKEIATVLTDGLNVHAPIPHGKMIHQLARGAKIEVGPRTGTAHVWWRAVTIPDGRPGFIAERRRDREERFVAIEQVHEVEPRSHPPIQDYAPLGDDDCHDDDLARGMAVPLPIGAIVVASLAGAVVLALIVSALFNALHPL